MPPVFSEGEYVYYQGDLHYISQVKGVLGFNLYTCINTSNGNVITSGAPGLARAGGSILNEMDTELPEPPQQTRPLPPPQRSNKMLI